MVAWWQVYDADWTRMTEDEIIRLRQLAYRLLGEVTDLRLNSTDRYTAEKELNRIISRLADEAIKCNKV